MSKIVPCLWFDDRAEEAAKFYVATFRACGQDAAIGEILHYGETGPRPKGTVLTVTFTLAGQEFSALNGGPQFTFSPAISMFTWTEIPRYRSSTQRPRDAGADADDQARYRGAQEGL